MPQMFIFPIYKKLAWNTSAQVIGKGISALAAFIMTILIARRFGAAGFGDFIKITTYIAFFYLLADFGFNAIFLQKKSRWEDLLVLRLIISSILVLCSGAILFLFPQGMNQGYTNVVRVGIILFAPSIVLQAIITTANALFQKHLRYDLSTVAVAAGSFTSIALIVLVFTGVIPASTIISTTTALLVGGAVTAVVSLGFTRKLERIPHSEVLPPRLWELFAASIPLGLTLLFNLVYFRIDSIILTITRTTAEVGIYGLAYKVFEITLVLPTFFMNALYPVMLESKKIELNKIVFRSSVFLFISSIIVSLCLWFGAPVISWVRNDFIPGIPVLRILSLGLPFFFLSSLTMWTLITRRKQVLLAGIYGVCMVVNVVLNILYVPNYGFMAAAWITVASEALVLAMTGAAVFREMSKESL